MSTWVRLCSGVALVPLLMAPAYAQRSAAVDSDALADIIVTGSSIRGVPPVGSNLVQVGQDQITAIGANTTQEIMASIPQLGTFNTAPRPDPRSNGILSTAPNIRGIGQAQTLVLVNGRRLVGTGHLQNISDPSIVPPNLVQRVEVLPDGASSIYGSDGIAGVVNVITLRDYDGVKTNFRYGFGSGYSLLNTGGLVGSRWDGGGVAFSVEYSKNSRLEGFDRDYVTNDFTAVGGQDNRSQNNCIPSSFKINNASGSPTGDFIEYGTGAHNVRCDNSQWGDLYPAQDRLSFYATGHHEFVQDIEVFFEAFHSKTNSNVNLAPFGAQGKMTRSNPFFPSSMVDPSVNSITAYYNVSNITGVRANEPQSIQVYGGTVGADVRLSDFMWTTYWTGSRSQTDLTDTSFNSAANVAAMAGTTIENALDPFTGRTSNAVKVGLADYELFFGSKQWMWELNSKIDGPLATLPGGDAKVAIGAVYRKEFYDGINTASRIGFLENAGREIGRRTVYSAYGELFVPAFGVDNAMPGFQRLDLSLSGRYDHYNDFGETFNPKVGVNWEPVTGLTLRGTYGKSFHAPALPDLYGPDTRAGYGTGGLTPAGVTPRRTGSIYLAGGNANLDAERSTNWSLGVDIAPPEISRLRLSATYYNVHFTGRIYYPNSSYFYVLPEYNRYFIDNIVCSSGTYPGGTGCTSLPIDPQIVYDTIKGMRLSTFPSEVNSPADLPPVYIISILLRTNLNTIDTSGIDFDASYQWNMGSDTMGVQIQGNRVLTYDQRAVDGAPKVSQFPFGQQKFRVRGVLSYLTGPLNASAMVNFSDKYRNQYIAVTGGTTVQSEETIGAFTSVDFHLGYNLPDIGYLSGTQLTFNLDNIFNADPPLMRSGSGYGAGNILGRVATFGISKAF